MRYPDVLSEKAKGKQRAVDPPTDTSEGQPSSSLSQPSRDLVVRFTEGSPDLTVSVDKDDTVWHLKRRVIFAYGNKNCQVKLTCLFSDPRSST